MKYQEHDVAVLQTETELIPERNLLCYIAIVK